MWHTQQKGARRVREESVTAQYNLGYPKRVTSLVSRL